MMHRSTLILAFSVVFLLFSGSVSGEEKKPKGKSGYDFHVGLRGCADFARFGGDKVNDAGWGAGIAFSLPVPVRGMTVQPELSYVQKAVGTGYVEIPAYLQAGLDLVLFRPFILFGPYMGYAVYKQDSSLSWGDINRFQAGLSVGGGLDIWKFQINARYSWNLTEYRKDAGCPKIRGAEVSLIFFF